MYSKKTDKKEIANLKCAFQQVHISVCIIYTDIYRISCV